MNFVALFSAPLAIQIHVYTALLAALIGAIILWRAKGTLSHKRWGKVWVLLMAVTSLSSFLIHEIQLVGPFSPIHLISVGVLISLYMGIKLAQSGNIKGHQQAMKSTYIGGIGIAGTLTLLPERLMYEVLIAPVIGTSSNFALFESDWFYPLVVFSVFIALYVIRLVSRRFKV